MSAIEKLLWIIESRFREAITLEDIANTSGLSKFHVSRLFAQSTGQTLSAYIRGRRLGIAAQQLADNAPDILQVALEAGYNSHEAFSRAFRTAYGTTPEAVRAARTIENLTLVEPIRMTSANNTKISAPLIATKPPIRLVGLKSRYKMTEMAGITDQWQQFVPWYEALSPNSHTDTFGVIIEVADDPASFDYMCALTVGSNVEVPEDLDVIDVPEMRVAAFKHDGHVSQIEATCNAIFSRALPEAGLTSSGPINFMEVYGPEFDAKTGNGGLEIWVNIGAEDATD